MIEFNPSVKKTRDNLERPIPTREKMLYNNGRQSIKEEVYP